MIPDAVGARFISGAVIDPVKMRFGNGKTRVFDFAQEFNLGLTVGAQFIYNPVHPDYGGFNLLVGFGITSVQLDSTNTGGMVMVKTNAAALTPSLNLVWDIPKAQIQVGASIGWDIIGGNPGKAWIYKKLPFLGIGISHNFFNKGVSTKKAAKNAVNKEQLTIN